MEQVIRAAGVINDIADPDPEPARAYGRHPYGNRRAGTSGSRVSLPLSHRRSFSTTGGGGGGRKSRAGSTQSGLPSGRDTPLRQRRISQSQRQQQQTPQPQQDGGEKSSAVDGTPATAAEPTFHDAVEDQADRRSEYRDLDDEEQQGYGEEEEEIPWGPDHPCFPHPNPHVPRTSPLFTSTRVIRVKRDWMLAGDVAPTFTTLYPEILDWFPSLSETAFKDLIKQLNDLLIAAFSPWRTSAWVDSILGLATGWIWDDLGLTRGKKNIAAAEALLERWNKEHGAADGVRFIPLRRTGYLTLDIQIPDPQIVDANAEDFEDDADNTADVDGQTDASGPATRRGRPWAPGGGAGLGFSERGTGAATPATDAADTDFGGASSMPPRPPPKDYAASQSPQQPYSSRGAASAAASGSMLARRGSGASGVSRSTAPDGGSSVGGASALQQQQQQQRAQPVVPPIPDEFRQESAALAITMDGFRDSASDDGGVSKR